MASTLAIGAVVFVLFFLFRQYRGLARNIAAAKASGLPFIIQPLNTFSVFWLATYWLWLPLIRKMPRGFQGLWVDLLDPEWSHSVGYRPFQELGQDVILVVSPSGRHAFVADAEVISQITTRRNDFPKPLEMYGRLDIYGKNLVTTEGSTWRMHRKLTGPSFGDKNNELVFTESLHHAQSLLNLWAGPDGKGSQTVHDPAADTMRFALYVISRAGFNVRVAWPHEEHQKPLNAGNTSPGIDPSLVGAKLPPGHKMSYREALSVLLENIMWTQMAPTSYLLKSPFKIHRDVGNAVIEWGKYMEELYDAKEIELTKGDSTDGMDLFGALIKGSGILDDPKEKQKGAHFEKSDLFGNAFVILLAGHETTANALHFSLVFLAMNRVSQKHLQEDLDKILGDKPVEDWNYEDDFPLLFNSMPAAVMNETLRLLQPAVNIPKSTPPDRPQVVTMQGKQHMIPGTTHVWLSAAVHRNPKYWPHSSEVDDVNKFRPERWIVGDDEQATTLEQTAFDDEDLRGPSGADTSAHLYKPPNGSYIPFSAGYRSCIGRRFAQVEILAVLAVIFKDYSVELDVTQFASDAEIERMPKGGAERKKIWQTAADRADNLLKTHLSSIITLQLRGAHIPLRLARRGEERFVFE